MKGLKLLAIVAGSLAALLALVLVLALTPSVQTWAVRKAVAGQPGLTLDLSRLGAGPSAADISDLRFSQDGVALTAKTISARYSAWDYLTKGRVNVDSLHVEDLVVDLRGAPSTPSAGSATRPASPASAPASAQPPRPATPATSQALFEGLLKQAQLPVDVRLADLMVRGRALLPDNRTVAFSLKGSSIETGQRGRIEWTLDFADATAGAALRALRATGGVATQLTADRRVSAVEVETLATASGPSLPEQQIKLVARAERPAPTGDETYAASVNLVRPGGATEPLAQVSARFLAASREISGTWEVALKTESLAALLSGLGLPEISADGSGKFTLRPDTRAVAASGELRARATQLGKVSPALSPIGAMRLKTAFDAALAGDDARLDRLELDVSGDDARPLLQVRSLQKIAYSLATKRVSLTDPKAELARLSVNSLPLAWAQPFAAPATIEGGDLSLTLAIEAEPDGSRVRARAVEPLALRAVSVSSDGKKLLDRATLTVRPAIDYSATKLLAQLADLRLSLPAGDTLSGTLSAEVANPTTAPATTFSAQLQARLASAHKPHLPLDPGPLALAVTLEGRHEGQSLQLAKLSLNASRDNGPLLVALDLPQPVRLDLKTQAISPANPSATAARLRLGQIPLGWADAFVPDAKLSGDLAGATFDVTLRSLDDLTVTTSQPLALRALGATLAGRPLAQALDLSADFTATKRRDDLSFDLRRLELKQGDAPLATLAVSGQGKLGAKLTVAAKGSLDADLAALTRQPALADFATLARGRLATAFEASLADATQAKATLSLKNLVAKQGNQPLGDLELTLDANLKPDGSGSVTLPLTLTRATRKSDLTLAGSFGKASNGKTLLLTGKISGNQIVIDDFQALAALAPASPQPTAATPAPATAPARRPAATPTATAAARDQAAFWSAANGKLDLDLQRVLYGKDYVIRSIRGAAVVTDSKLSLDGLEGRFNDNPFKLAAGVTFAPSAPKPYTLTGSANVSNFDVGAFLRAANPNDLPSLESKVTIQAKLNGTGANLADLTQSVYGQFDLEGSKGVTRALARQGGAGQAVNLAATALSILGAARGSDTTSALGALAGALNEMPFDKFTMHVERDAALNIKVSKLEFISPVMRMTGAGGLTRTAASGDAIENQPMRFDLQLAAKDHLALLFNKAGVLSPNRDDKGYYQISQPFTIGGTPAKPDSSQLWQFLAGAAARAAAGALLR